MSGYGRWFQVRVKHPGQRRWETFTHLADPSHHPDGQTKFEVYRAFAGLYPALGTQIEVEITEKA